MGEADMSDGIAFFSPEPVGASMSSDTYSPFRPETELDRQSNAKRYFAAPAAPTTRLIDVEVRNTEMEAARVALPLINTITKLARDTSEAHRDNMKPISPLVFDEAVRWAQIVVRAGLAVANQDQISLPAVIRTQAGGIQFEWHRKNLDLEIEVGPNGQGQAYLEDAAVGEPIEADLAEGLGRIQAALEIVLVR
jgi:hypothetical protein